MVPTSRSVSVRLGGLLVMLAGVLSSVASTHPCRPVPRGAWIAPSAAERQGRRHLPVRL